MKIKKDDIVIKGKQQAIAGAEKRQAIHKYQEADKPTEKKKHPTKGHWLDKYA